MKLIVGLLVITAPAWVPRLVPDRKKPTQQEQQEQEEEDDEDVRELRDTLISVLQKLQKAEAQVEALTKNLAAKDDELLRERAQTAALTQDLVQLRGEVHRMQGLFEMVMEQRRGSMPPPTGL